MKKVIYTLLALPLLFTSCKEEMGTMPGTDKDPNVVLYTYEPADENLNPDNDVTVRFATNNATKEVYYLVEDAATVDAAIESSGEGPWVSKVLESGSKITVNGAENVEVDVTGIIGLKYILAVATDGVKGEKLSKIAFRGLEWETVTTGTFQYGSALTFLPISGTVGSLDVCTTNKLLYRIKDAFGTGSHLKLNVINGSNEEDEDGEYVLFRVVEQKTPFSVSFADGTVSEVTVEDVGYWQNNASFVTSATTNYCNIMYLSDGYVMANIAWMSTKGCLAYGAFDTKTCVFIPD